jgi:hypothetical protein
MKVDTMGLGIEDGSVCIRELSIVVVAQNHNPTILNPDFLSRNEIVPADWNLAQAPVCIEPLAHVQYANGISVVSEPQKIVFTQHSELLEQETIVIAEMVRKYINAVPHVDYRGLGINPKGDIAFKTEEESRRYIMERLIAPGPWQDYGEAPVRGSAAFVFQLGEARLHLKIQAVRRNVPGGIGPPVVVFLGNYHYDFTSVPRNNLLEVLNKALDNWGTCWVDYTKLVNSIFV